MPNPDMETSCSSGRQLPRGFSKLSETGFVITSPAAALMVGVPLICIQQVLLARALRHVSLPRL